VEYTNIIGVSWEDKSPNTTGARMEVRGARGLKESVERIAWSLEVKGERDKEPCSKLDGVIGLTMGLEWGNMRRESQHPA